MSYREPAPHNFSFNSPQGACPKCKGLGVVNQIDVDKEQDLAAAFGIRSIPTLLMIPMKEEPRIMQGAMPKTSLKKQLMNFS